MSVAEDRIHEAMLSERQMPRHDAAEPDHEILIIGAGFAGMGAAIELLSRGIKSFSIIERADDVGGTWRDNRYPGVAVDITSFTYSFSFEQDPNWSRVFAPGDELQNYARRVASKYGLYPYMRFGVSVERAEFDEDPHLWQVTTDKEVVTARHLVSATGGLISPKMPDIEGVEDFQGERMHTARWDHNADLTGKRVAVIGTGATAVQLIPEIAGKAKQLDVYQRTPIWVLKKPDGELPNWLKTLFRLVPRLQRTLRGATDTVSETLMVLSAVYYRQAPWLVRMCEKAGMNNLREQLPDHPEFWDKLTPQYGFGCKRPTFSNEYFRTFARDNVELVTTPIQRITPRGIETTDGVEHDIDVLILTTGYKVFEKGNLPSYEVVGRGGTDLGEFWEENRYQAYEGLTIPGYPNFYIMLGPYALIGTSYFKMVEGNAIHLSRCIREAAKRGATRVEIRQPVHDAYFRDIERRQQNTVFLNHNCAQSNSYYFDHHGDAPMLRPSTSVEMLWRAKHLPMNHYRFSGNNRRGIILPKKEKGAGELARNTS
jgi:cation diffusion facilitator CzcD-associated flavoprotein CzcO